MEVPEELTPDHVDAIALDGGHGLVAARIGFLATLYFREPGEPETRRRLADCIDLLASTFGDRIRWLKPEEKAPFQGVRGLRGSDYTAALVGTPTYESIDFMAHSGTREQDAGHFMINAYAPLKMPKEQLGFLSFAAAVGELAARQPGMVVGLVTRLCDLLLPLHGYAGLGIIRNPNPYTARRTDHLVVPLARRFAGLELDMPATHVLKLRDGIKGVNWLTMVSDRLADRAGGCVALAQAATAAGLGTLGLASGLIIQAGATPQFGDLEAAGIPAPYHRADTLLKPLRSSGKDILTTETIAGLTPREFSASWYARFESGHSSGTS